MAQKPSNDDMVYALAPAALAPAVATPARSAAGYVGAQAPPAAVGDAAAAGAGADQRIPPPPSRKSLVAAPTLEGLLDSVGAGTGTPEPRVSVATDIAAAVSDALSNVAANGESLLRLNLLPADFDRLRVDPTDPNSVALRADRVEAVALAGGARARTRVDAVARWCEKLKRLAPRRDEPRPAEAPPAPERTDLEQSLAAIVDAIAHGVAPIITARGDDASIRGRLRALDLAVGPADRVAFFDYGVLIGTVDGVWQELVDREAIALRQLLQEAQQAAAPGPGATAKWGLGGLGSFFGHVFNFFHGGSEIFGALGDHLRGDDSDEPKDPGAPIVPPPQMPPRPVAPERSDYSELIAELNERLSEPYSFRVFAADGDDRAIDFGLFVTYRQTWSPEGHQAGSLVKTTTLAPREERGYITRTTYKSSTTAVRATNVENQRRSESQDTNKSTADIVRAAKSTMGFEAESKGTIEVGKLISADSSAKYTLNRERSSQETRQAMRESVRKAAQEVKESLRTEITTTESRETFNEETGKISNPNDELPVTYLFYELLRRFRVSERLHEMSPVVMVARAVPRPDQITRAWLVTYAWNLQRGLLDDELREPLRYLMTDAAGLEARVRELQQAHDERRELVKKLEGEVLTIADQLVMAYQNLQHPPQTGGGPGGVFPLSPEALQKVYDLAIQRDQIVRQRLAEATAARDAATQAYTEALGMFRDRELGVRRLRIHVKQNILHYMRVIWNMEDRDQRFFELQTVKVPRLAGHLEYRLAAEQAPPVPPHWIPPYTIEATLVPEPVDPNAATMPLGDIADLEHPLGYKGNFMVFPLRQHNVLTKFLALPYLDNLMGAQDPELLANYTLSELDTYVACAEAAMAPKDFDALVPEIQKLYTALLDRPFPDEQEIVVPTDSTFIEALPGTRPVLEDYKLLHRAIDVSKAAAEVRARELENLRLVARIRDGQLSDPDIQTMVVAPEDAGIGLQIPPTRGA